MALFKSKKEKEVKGAEALEKVMKEGTSESFDKGYELGRITGRVEILKQLGHPVMDAYLHNILVPREIIAKMYAKASDKNEAEI